ncbi:MAG TPA: cytochrome c oxidase subunit 3, partial [Kaistia sp.]|nr:cytochrome c oxidase subunit 3 [Kaistia sp.]
AWYWHFVDVVWLFLFFTIYVWGGWGAPMHGG